MKNKIILLISILFITCLSGCNRQMIDLNYNFNYAYINIGDKVIEGKVESWRDYEDSNQIQVKINGVTYYASSNNIVLVYDPNK